MHELAQYSLPLRYHVALIRERHFVPHFGLNNISRTAKISDNRYRTGGKSFKNHPCAVIANRRKHKDVCGSQLRQGLCVVEPTTKLDTLLDPEGCHQPFESILLRAVAYHGKSCQIFSQYWRRRAQREIAGLSRNQAANENQLELATFCLVA